MKKRAQILEILDKLNIDYELHEHPPVPTVEEALPYWNKIDATHCKNLFFRDHKGRQHYLAICEHSKDLDIKSLEQRIKRGKLTLASEWRMDKYLDLKPGSVSAFGLINDHENHVRFLIDKELMEADCLGFHPNDNTASLVINYTDLLKFLDVMGNTYEFIDPTPDKE